MGIQVIVVVIASFAVAVLLFSHRLEDVLPSGEKLIEGPVRLLRGSNRLMDDALRMTESKSVRLGPQTHMPNDILVKANAEDIALDPEEFSHFFAEMVRARAAELGYVLDSDVEVRIVADPALRRGKTEVVAEVRSSTKLLGHDVPAAAGDDSRSRVLRAANGGADIALIPGSEITIGKSRLQADAQVNLQAISRSHCSVRLSLSGEVSIKDHSTNGTFLNSTEVSGIWRSVAVGDVIRLGPEGAGLPSWTLE